MLTVKEYAERSGLDKREVYRLIKKGVLKAVPSVRQEVKNKKILLIPVNE